MKHYLLFFILTFIHIFQKTLAWGQHIIAPDTICSGTTVSLDFNHSNQFTSYTWAIGHTGISPILNAAYPIPNTGTIGNTMFSVVAQATMVFDINTNTYRAFTTSASSGYTNPSLQRLDFGTDPNSAPTAVNLGNPNNSFIVANYSNMQAVEFALDQSGIYHAFITNRGIVHLIFGNGLDNPPTQATRIFNNPSQMVMGMQLALKHYNGNWYLFAGNAYGLNHIMRFNLGNNLNTIPLPVSNFNIPAPPGGFGGYPCYFSILKRGTNWHMTVTVQGSNSPLFQYNFGNDLLNNNPNITYLGASGIFNIRGLNFVTACDSFYQIGLSQAGALYTFNYNNNILSTPTLSTYGSPFGNNQALQMLKPYWYNDTLWALSSSYINDPVNTVFRTPLLKNTSGNTITKWYHPHATYTFNTPGVFDITLYCDQADPAGPETYCKKIVVINSAPSNSPTDTTICTGDTIRLAAKNITSNSTYTWNTGATTPFILTHLPGTYWVNYSNSCGTFTDSFHIQTVDRPVLSIEAHQLNICEGDSIVLSASGAGHYRWTPTTYLSDANAATPVSKPSESITYYVQGYHHDQCSSTDSVNISVSEVPKVKITASADSISCFNTSVQLNASGAMRYEWEPQQYCDNPDIPNPTVHPPAHTTFYVKGYNENNCSSDMDSFTVLAFTESVFFIPNSFSPNGDGINDLFFPIIFCDFNLELFKVFNRNGQVVFSTATINTSWDGSFRGQPCDIGTYFWYIEGTRDNGDKVVRKGDVTLLR